MDNNKPRIGFIITKAETGGAQRWTLDQIGLLQDDIHPFLITGEDQWLTQTLSGLSPLILPDLLKRIPSPIGLMQLRRYIRDNRISTLVASSANAGVYARLMKLFTPGLRVVYVSHGWSSIYNGGKLSGIYTLTERLLSTLTDLVINVSQADASKCDERLNIPPGKSVTLTNRTPKPTKQSANLPSKPVKLLFLGRLAHPKRPDLLIDAVSGFSANDLTLTIVGSGPAQTQLQANAPNNVVFAGEIRAFDQFHRYHALCLISDSEGLPMSALEAKANELPLLLSDVGGCHELIDNGNGILCDNTPDSIRHSLHQLITNMDAMQAAASASAPNAWLEPAKMDYLHAYLGTKPGA
ncbi:Glycosyltransferase involved in cell wall bisynthesis [Alcanivorax sp. DSM 26293]|uniref:glycosyltransferase n=1 Tax=Alcanivorax sp. DSM 26293 TaxID=1798238 RepID=UPI0008A07350|nr:glycosyltransferase [Alcanivorax sp. DSM 26293]SEF39757.1 Glycosyltransferase involved in cell wall bisynthesis [Alcanivorax sp. DSM 26293]